MAASVRSPHRRRDPYAVGGGGQRTVGGVRAGLPHPRLPVVRPAHPRPRRGRSRLRHRRAGAGPGAGSAVRVLWAWMAARPVQRFPDATAFFAAPDHANAASLRVLDKVGFERGTWFDEPQSGGGVTPPSSGCSLDVRRVLGSSRLARRRVGDDVPHDDPPSTTSAIADALRLRPGARGPRRDRDRRSARLRRRQGRRQGCARRHGTGGARRPAGAALGRADSRVRASCPPGAAGHGHQRQGRGPAPHRSGSFDPQGVPHRPAASRRPPTRRSKHDFLWRIEKGLPDAGYIGVYDSHSCRPRRRAARTRRWRRRPRCRGRRPGGGAAARDRRGRRRRDGARPPWRGGAGWRRGGSSRGRPTPRARRSSARGRALRRSGSGGGRGRSSRARARPASAGA